MTRRRGSRFVRARVALQLTFLALVVAFGAQFTVWALAHIEGRTPVVSRPAGVEGFLPISALMSLRLWLAGGGIHPVHPAGLAILLAIVAMSAVLAKSFCSHLCPVGAVSEWLGRFGTRLLGRTWQPPRWLDLPLRSLKLAPDKINLASLGNVVPHLHWHVIPRFADDPHFPNPVWGAKQRNTPHAAPSDLNTQLSQALSRLLARPETE